MFPDSLILLGKQSNIFGPNYHCYCFCAIGCKSIIFCLKTGIFSELHGICFFSEYFIYNVRALVTHELCAILYEVLTSSYKTWLVTYPAEIVLQVLTLSLYTILKIVHEV